MKLATTVFLILFGTTWALSQEREPKPELKTAGDCKAAVPLSIAKSIHYGPTQAPKSYGTIQEITTKDKDSELSFMEEHNSAWYLLTIKFDGSLEFDIVPTDTSNDYDFLLYSYKDSNFCDRVLNRTVIPVRSNISNNTFRKTNGVTGLSVNATKAFYGQGAGDPFSVPVNVKKGDQYMLVLDNVTPNGAGHTIYFHQLKKVVIKGVVLNEDSLPVIADIKFADPQGKTVVQSVTDVKGAYEITAGIEENKNYSLTFTNDSSFIGTRIVNTSTLKEGNSFPAIKTLLPKLKKGAKYPLGNINFYPGVDKLLSTSIPSVEALFHLMKKIKE